MKIYILPTSEQGMQDRALKYPKGYEYSGGLKALPFLDGLSDALKEMGHEVHTTDFWSLEKNGPGDVLVMQDHPVFTWFWRTFYRIKYFRTKGGFILARRKFLYDNYRFFKRRVLIHAESPMVTTYVYNNLQPLKHSGIYHKMMFTSRGWGEDLDYFNLYDYRNQSIISPFFQDKKDRFLILLNSNARPRALFREFYSERLKAIKYFSNVPGFDLCGGGWGKRPRHPLYLHYKKYVDRAWKGRVDDKMEVLSKYKFAICYENAPYNGYVTEKIYDCLATGTIPIYLGAPDIETIVPSDCFIDFRKFSGYPALHKHLLSLSEANIKIYRQNMLRFLNNTSRMKGMKILAKKVLGIID
ncbi:MAG: glycosyltransferase family 10 [Patescibacteria group bacterium]